MNITELARKLKVSTAELREKLPELGFDIGLRAIKIDDRVAEQAVKKWREMEAKTKNKKAAAPEETPEKEEEKPLSEKIALPTFITVRQFAEKLNLPVVKIIGELLKNGVVANINEKIDYEIAAIVAQEMGYKTSKLSGDKTTEESKTQNKLKELLKGDDESNSLLRPPVVVVMGHVDHGKTTLLDAIRQTKVVASESGGITQHLGAYQVERNGRFITFIDTPGHEAFKNMRLRGGRVADIAILVVAADDGLQPQTLESIKIIQQEELPFVVAINKIDKHDANIEKIKQGLAQINLLPEDWGGQTICVPLSAKTKEGLDDLLDMILLVADMNKNKLLANPEREAVGTIIESRMDKGEGPVAIAIIHTGTLKVKDNVITGRAYGTIKALKDFRNKFIDKATPGMPVKILGLKKVPEVGDILQAIADKKDFKNKIKNLGPDYRPMTGISEVSKKESGEGMKVLNVVLRADVRGSLEAICESLEQIENPEFKLNIIQKGLGNIIESDVLRAKMSEAVVIGFHVAVSPGAAILAKDKGVETQTFKIIYKLLDFIKEKLSKFLKPQIIRTDLGEVKILAVFRAVSNYAVIGGQITGGKMIKGSLMETVRKEGNEFQGVLVQLQTNKQDVDEATEGMECGMKIEGRTKIQVGDILKAYKEEKRERKLET